MKSGELIHFFFVGVEKTDSVEREIFIARTALVKEVQ